ncbi:MAG: hypothetical protein ACJ741_14815 [Pyrinomonadaceae bacterium]
MKTLSRLLVLAALATAFSLPAFAQDAAASPAGPCDEQARTDLYTDYYNKKKTDQKAAYEVGKQYLGKYESCADKYTESVKKFVTLYEGATRRFDFFNAYNAKDVAKTNSLAQQLLATDPNDAAVALLSAWGTYTGVTLKNPAATDADAVSLANRALDVINSGKEPTDLNGKVSWAPFANRDDAVSYLNFAVASLELKTNTDDATKRLVQIAQNNGKAKEEPQVYSYLAFAYEKEAAPLLAKYKTFTVENDESKLVLANLNQVIDRMIDAYARAVAFSKDQTQKTEFMTRLTELYKSRHEDKTDGLDAMIASIKAQPLLLTQPITSLPAAVPAPTPTDGAAATTPAGTTVAAPASSTAVKPAPATTTTATNPPAKKKP